MSAMTLGNVILLFAVLRRLNAHEEKLASFGVSPDSVLTSLIGRQAAALGIAPSEHEEDGQPAPTRTRLVGLFSAGCQPCHEQASEFAGHPDAERLAVVVAEAASESERNELISALGGSPHLVFEPTSTKIVQDLGVHGFPTMLVVDDTGTVLEAEHALDRLERAKPLASTHGT
jgi:hypothetical protein